MILTSVDVRDLRPSDWPEVAEIYEAGIATRLATFETRVPSWEEWDRAHSAYRVVAVEDGRVVGWATLSPTSPRECYAGVMEESVYVAPDAQGRGVGRALLEALIERAEDVWTIQAGVFPENVASIELHKRCGFRVVGVQERIGQLDGEWRDVVLLERRKP